MNRQRKIALMLNSSRGQNPISNGTFDSATTGWSAINSPTTFESIGGQAHLVANGNARGFGQSFALVNGATYQVDYDYQVEQGTGFTVSKTGMPSQSAQTGMGHKTFTFQAQSGASTTLQFLTSGVGDHEFFIDNVEFRRVL